MMVEVGHPACPHMIDQPDRMEAELLASMRPLFELMPRLAGLRREQSELNFLTHWKLTPVRDWREHEAPDASVSHANPQRVNHPSVPFSVGQVSGSGRRALHLSRPPRTCAATRNCGQDYPHEDSTTHYP
jgi:hypothetical protein